MTPIPPPRRWALLTGVPRSGTTFAGKVLATPASVDYLHEPFNPDAGIEGVTRRYWWVDNDSAEEPQARRLVEALQRYDVRFRTAVYARDSAWKARAKRLAGSRGRFTFRWAKVNPLHRTALVKDPVGCLLTGYLVREHGFRAAVLLRHPVAVVHSFDRLGWPARDWLAALRDQEELVARHLGDDLDVLGADWETDWEAAAVLWRVLNRVMLSEAHTPGVVVVRHEDLSRDPVAGFRSVAVHLGLPWSARVRRRVQRLTSGGNRVEARGRKVQDFARDSARLLDARLDSTAHARRARIFEITEPVARAHYNEASFRMERSS
ncbi:MAG: sulfotransferase [Actinobacteria bacterium]|nr:sulfotransferase [Actinomycetota bacterium]